MKQRIFLFMIIAAFLISQLTQLSVVFAASGVAPDISWFNPDKPKKSYTIQNEAQLRGLAKIVNTSQASWEPRSNFKGVSITLKKDIKLTGNWTPIGYSDLYTFKGTFDGNKHKISGFSIKKETESNMGLFGYFKGTVKNLSISGSIQTEGGAAGGIVGYMCPESVVENCTSSVNIQAKGNKIGGIAGNCLNGNIIKCYNTGNITGSAKVGGIAGDNWGGRIEKSGNEGDILSTGRGVGTFGTGGVAGRSVAATAQMIDCFNKGNISGKNECIGGVVGFTSAEGSSLINCYNVGIISGAGKDSFAGGVLGCIAEDGVNVFNCYNAGALKNAQHIGGVLGSYDAKYYENIEDHISNNYYLEDVAKLAVGLEKERPGNISYSKTAVPISAVNLSSPKMSYSLGSAYKSDALGIEQQNHGYPILEWQQKVKKVENTTNNGKSPLQEILDQDGSIGSSFMNPMQNVTMYYGHILDSIMKEKDNKNIM